MSIIALQLLPMFDGDYVAQVGGKYGRKRCGIPPPSSDRRHESEIVHLSSNSAMLLVRFVLALAELAGTYNHIQGPAKRQAPGCVNAAGKGRQEW